MSKQMGGLLAFVVIVSVLAFAVELPHFRRESVGPHTFTFRTETSDFIRQMREQRRGNADIVNELVKRGIETMRDSASFRAQYDAAVSSKNSVERLRLEREAILALARSEVPSQLTTAQAGSPAQLREALNARLFPENSSTPQEIRARILDRALSNEGITSVDASLRADTLFALERVIANRNTAITPEEVMSTVAAFRTADQALGRAREQVRTESARAGTQEHDALDALDTAAKNPNKNPEHQNPPNANQAGRPASPAAAPAAARAELNQLHEALVGTMEIGAQEGNTSLMAGVAQDVNVGQRGLTERALVALWNRRLDAIQKLKDQGKQEPTEAEIRAEMNKSIKGNRGEKNPNVLENLITRICGRYAENRKAGRPVDQGCNYIVAHFCAR